ncbi:MAG: redoxin domain-containing protein [Elusimicrobiales bacterium]|nr:redoxin domain-containing protein [Elusimicrobiales bacterium]
MKRLLLAALLLAPAACADKPGERPKLAKAGQPAPELRLPKLLNAPLPALSGWQDLKGKAVVLEFWATWCEPCVDNIPHLNGLVRKFRDKPVVFISVTDESESEVAAFLEEHKLETWVAPGAGPEAFKAFRVYGRPHTVLIGRDGKVTAFTYPSDVTAETVEALLAGSLRPDEGRDSSLHADEDAGPDPSVLAEFYLARSSGAASVKYRHESFTARALTLRMAFSFLLGGVDRLDLGPGTREAVDASYDIRITAPSSGPDRKGELFLKGLAFSTGLKVSVDKREEEVYALRTVAGGVRNARRRKDFAEVSFDGVTLKTAGSSFGALAMQLDERLGLPVLDETKEDGPLEYTFTFETRDPRVMDAQLRRDLGLRLDRVKRRIRVVTVRR